MKNPNDTIGNRTRDSGSHNAVPSTNCTSACRSVGQPLCWHVKRAARPAVWHSSNLHQSINKNSVGIQLVLGVFFTVQTLRHSGRTANNNTDGSQEVAPQQIFRQQRGQKGVSTVRSENLTARSSVPALQEDRCCNGWGIGVRFPFVADSFLIAEAPSLAVGHTQPTNLSVWSCCIFG